MFKQIKIPNVLYEMAQDIERKKKRKIEKIFEEYIKKNGKNFRDDAEGIFTDASCGSKELKN